MRAAAWVRRMWAGEAGIPGALVRTLLLPAEAVFRVGAGIRRRRWDRKPPDWASVPIPVVSVGNLSVGGTGKTPVAAWVVRVLREAGATPALVSRGYGRDELLLHRRWNPGAPVVADPDRPAAVAEAARAGATVAVADDGFQHRRLPRKVDLVLVSAEEGLPGALLPRGPFREPLGALRRAHGVVVTRKEASAETAARVAREAAVAAPGIPVARLRLETAGWRPLGPAPEAEGMVAPAGEGDATSVWVATGVARPESVVSAAESLGWEVAGLDAFPDHHEFSAADLEGIRSRAGGRALVITEKDAVKLESIPGAAEGDVRVLQQSVVWEAGEEDVRRLLARVVEEVLR